MANHQQVFIEDALASSALRFGQYTLKSGRISPYFFNLGLFNTGAHLSHLATAYAETILAHSGLEFEVLFGPAYKGISLAALTAAKLAELAAASKTMSEQEKAKWTKIEYAYNRKEKKDHGEGGTIVGSDLAGKRVLIIDDVITAGTAIKEAFTIISDAGAKVAGVILALDRRETTVDSDRSAVQIISETYKVPVISIVSIVEIIKFLDGKISDKEMDAIKEYRAKYAPAE